MKTVARVEPAAKRRHSRSDAESARRDEPRRPPEHGRGPVPLESPAMPLAEVARRLAISRAAAYRLVTSGQLPGIRIGTSWRVLRVDFDAYLDRMRAEAERRYRHVRG